MAAAGVWKRTRGRSPRSSAESPSSATILRTASTTEQLMNRCAPDIPCHSLTKVENPFSPSIQTRSRYKMKLKTHASSNHLDPGGALNHRHGSFRASHCSNFTQLKKISLSLPLSLSLCLKFSTQLVIWFLMKIAIELQLAMTWKIVRIDVPLLEGQTPLTMNFPDLVVLSGILISRFVNFFLHD
jgi:hypothetical protein